MTLKSQLMAASREDVLRFLAAVVSELTLAGRYAYGRPDAEQRLAAVNEATHRVVNHLRDLLDPVAILTESRAEGILEVLRFLGPESCARILNRYPLSR